MSFSSLFYRGVRLLCRPFVKLDKKIERKQEGNARKNAQSEAEKVLAMSFNNERDPFFEKINIITHAGGGLQGMAYLNCEESFPFYYEKGNRVFEYDVDEKDGAFILAHAEDGIAGDLDGRFTSLTLEKALDNLKAYPDITVIFDSKFKNLKPFAQFVKEYVQEESALNRVVIQVFNEENVLHVREVYNFKMLHVCMMATDYVETIQTCIKHKIGAVSISTKALRERFDWGVFEKNNICVFAYTVNTLKEYQSWKDKGITGVFSDFLYDTDVK